MFKRFTTGSVQVVNRWLQAPLLYAIILTIVVFIAAMIGTQQCPQEFVWSWGGQGEVKDGIRSLLTFAKQMALLLVLMKFVLRCDVSVIASSNKSMEELPKLSRYQKFIMVFFVTVIVLLLFPSFVPKPFIVCTVLNNVGATGILLGAVGVYIMVSLKEGMPAVQLFSKNIGWSIIFILAAALSIADAMDAESKGISAWLE